MEVAITKMSQNGQIVIPSDIRREAGLNASAKFVVISHGKNILLKFLNEDSLREELALLKNISRAEAQISKGNFISADTSMSVSSIKKLLKKNK